MHIPPKQKHYCGYNIKGSYCLNHKITRKGENMNLDDVPMIIKGLRESYGYTQGYVGKKLDISQQAYSNYEMGKRELPARHAAALAKLYHVSTDYIYGIVNEPIATSFPEAEYVKNISYQKLLQYLLRLNLSQRSNVLSYLNFLRNKE